MNASFSECRKTSTIEIFGDIPEVGYCVFVNWESLESITINSNTLVMKHCTFEELPNLTTTTIPEKVISIANDCQLRKSKLHS